MDLADPRNIELTLGSKFGVLKKDAPLQQRLGAKAIRTGPTMFPDLAVVVMKGAINPRLDNIRPAALPTSAMSVGDTFTAVGFGSTTNEGPSAQSRAREAEMTVNECPADIAGIDNFDNWYQTNFCVKQHRRDGFSKLCTGIDPLRQLESGDGGEEFYPGTSSMNC